MEEDAEMDSHGEAKKENYLYRARESVNNRRELKATKGELIKTREEIKRSRDRATQSWLDSKPLIDELEKLKSVLESAKKRCSKSNVVISDLQSQLENVTMSIKQKKEEELKVKMKITEINLALDQTREEMENLKIETNEERRARSKLKKDLRLKKQTLRTLQFTLRAIRIETEAFGSSAAESLELIKRSEMDDTKIELTYEEYQALTRRAKEETSLADWRVSVSMEQKLAAEASRNSALRRLKELRSRNRSRRRMGEENVNRDRNPAIVVEEKEPDLMIAAETQEVNNKQIAFPIARAEGRSEAKRQEVNNKQIAFPIGRAEVISEAKTQEVNNKQIAFPIDRAEVRSEATRRKRPRQFERSGSNARLEMNKKKKKSSIFQQIKSCFLRKLTRFFG